MKQTNRFKLGLVLMTASAFFTYGVALLAAQEAAPLPTYPLKFGAFVVRFDPGGTFTLKGQGWP